MWLKSLYFYRPIRTILWGIPSILLVRVYLSSKLQTGVLIKSIDLIDNGEDILITLISGKTLRAKISGIKKPNIAIAGPAMYSYNKAGMNIIPIETNGSILMVDGSGNGPYLIV